MERDSKTITYEISFRENVTKMLVKKNITELIQFKPHFLTPSQIDVNKIK